MNGPNSKSSEPKILFELGSIFKNQSSNFRGSTVFRDMSREIQAFEFPTSRFPYYLFRPQSLFAPCIYKKFCRVQSGSKQFVNDKNRR